MIVKINFINDNYILETYAFLTRYVLYSFYITFTLQIFITISSKTHVRSINFQKIFCDEFQQALIVLLPHRSTKPDLKANYFPKLLKWRQVCFLFLVFPAGFCDKSVEYISISHHSKHHLFCSVVWWCQGLGLNLV